MFFEVKRMHIEKIACSFRIDGTPVSCKEFGSGHINYTVKVLTDTGKEYVLQRINKYVFKDPVKVMSNVGSVTAFLRNRVDDSRMALHFISTFDDLYYFLDDEGEYWRMYDFIGGFCLDAPESDEDFYQSALAFGRFQHMLSEFPAHTLYETIPEFHNTIDRYRQLRESIAADAAGRLASVQADVDFLMEREELGCTLQRLRESGELPLRVTHNDTKLNNVLLDKDTRTSLCVLDLDTVMPGLSLYDFGDSIRFGAATAPEDEPDTSKMSMDLHLFEVYTKGFLEAATSLTDKEVELLPMGAFVITLELATRFMKDYLDGDLYFKTAYPEHNLVRARAQMKLAADMQSKFDEMNRIVAEVAQRVRG
ncbi:MAG: aminoglycoside phosphotransferase family protein [Ruminococcaceae bacterium]|nr:aminoglycoside phosphotransferase family protein [Oscillospiraceae bacterium]